MGQVISYRELADRSGQELVIGIEALVDSIVEEEQAKVLREALIPYFEAIRQRSPAVLRRPPEWEAMCR